MINAVHFCGAGEIAFVFAVLGRFLTCECKRPNPKAARWFGGNFVPHSQAMVRGLVFPGSRALVYLFINYEKAEVRCVNEHKCPYSKAFLPVLPVAFSEGCFFWYCIQFETTSHDRSHHRHRHNKGKTCLFV